MEVIINKVGSDWVLANNSVKVEISSPGYKTVVPGYIKRLQPGDQAKVSSDPWCREWNNWKCYRDGERHWCQLKLTFEAMFNIREQVCT